MATRDQLQNLAMIVMVEWNETNNIILKGALIKNIVILWCGLQLYLPFSYTGGSWTEKK